MINLEQKLALFEVSSDKDRKLLESINVSKYQIKIQGGAVKSDKRICEYADDIGEDNISDRNHRYSELSAIYWIWKNIKCDYIGIEHYRRKMIISDAELDELMNQNIDIINISSVSLGNQSIEEAYRLYHYGYDMDYMFKIIKELYPKDEKKIREVFQGNIMYPYCMAIYRYEVFEECCKWLFPILERLHYETKEKACRYQRRDIGFIGERLLSAYYIINKEKYKSKQVNCIELETEVEKIELSSDEAFYCFINNSIKNRAFVAIADCISSKGMDVFSEYKSVKEIFSVYFYEKMYAPITMMEYLGYVDYNDLKRKYAELKDVLVGLDINTGKYDEKLIKLIKNNGWGIRAIYAIVAINLERPEVIINYIASLFVDIGMLAEAKELLLQCEKNGISTELTQNNLLLLKDLFKKTAMYI